MVICDTNILIQAYNGNIGTIDELDRIGRSNIALSAITVMELYQGMRDKNELDSMKKKIKYFDVLEITPPISILARKYVAKYKLSQGLKIPDAIIAATTIIHQVEIFTYNLKDFKFIPGIRIYNYKGINL